ncbi:hypothetical protein NDN08_000673 [Rhodosorus marinus]|uniref:Poly A polymerase head domain-containing protein n=1 Tax=Rhodosorus marinus TaxID=101924 RepID=A0AAV8UNR8_9RHOD|nr:hypothetical protein NDN08_000673 [Rhodosorus marinus]
MGSQETDKMTSKRKRDWADSPIPLSSLEEKIFGFLVKVLKDERRKTVLRVAGGWVRDKLLQLACDDIDIDIALDDISGKDFAHIVEGHLEKSSEHSSVAVIHMNPDKSKHLETARIKIFDVWIDLVNLRTETYADSSRVPDIVFGTAEEDALRRDLTINALFYNINDGVVEDLTGSGLTDLREGIIRTPLEPRTTFLDDPLRALRAIRFAGKLGFKVSPDIIEACRLPEVRSALEAKVSKERIGVEVDKMLCSGSPLTCVSLLHDLSLFTSVFLPNGMPKMDPLEFEIEEAPMRCLNTVSKFLSTLESSERSLPKELLRIGLFASLLRPFGGKNVHSAESKPNRPVTVAAHIIRHCLKLRGRDADEVNIIHVCSAKLENPSFVRNRLNLGTLVRESKELLPTVLLHSQSQNEDISAEEIHRTIIEMKLENAASLKPLLNGKQVMKLLPKLPKGPELGEIMQEQIEWQLANQEVKEDQCKQWIAEKHVNFL